MWGTSSTTRSRAGAFIDGQGSSPMCMKESSSQGRETAEEPSGGQMAVGIKASSRTACNAAMALSIVRAVHANTRASGRTACSTARAYSTSTTANVTKATSRRISSTAMVSSTRMTPLSTVSGRTMSSLS